MPAIHYGFRRYSAVNEPICCEMHSACCGMIHSTPNNSLSALMAPATAVQQDFPPALRSVPLPRAQTLDNPYVRCRPPYPKSHEAPHRAACSKCCVGDCRALHLCTGSVKLPNQPVLHCAVRNKLVSAGNTSLIHANLRIHLAADRDCRLCKRSVRLENEVSICGMIPGS